MSQHFLRSIDNYDHEFNLADKVEVDGIVTWKLRIDPENNQPYKWILRGRAHNNKNISIIDNDQDFEYIMSFEQIKVLMKRNVVSIIEEIPKTFYSAMELASQNAGLLRNLEGEKEVNRQQIIAKDNEIEELKQKLKDAGVV